MNEEKKTWLDRIGLIHLWATIKAALDNKVDKIPGFNLSENNYSTEDKTKLDGLFNYEHPTTPGNKHIPAGGIKNQILRWKEDGTAQWDNETPPPEYKVMTPASESSAGDSGLVPSPPVGSQNKVLRGDGTWADDENTWRPVQDNLDTDSAEDSLSAAQGKVLKGLVDGKSDKEHQHVFTDITDRADHIYDAGLERVSRTVLAAPEDANGPATFRELNKNDVGLGNVDNTADVDKSVSNAKTADRLTGFSAAVNDQGWGNQTGTLIHAENDSTGGSIAFRRDNPNAGQVSMIIDGRFYQNEGNYMCLDTQNYSEYALPKSGGTMTNGATIKFADSGTWNAGNGTYPRDCGGLSWTGQSDGVHLYAEEVSGDNLDLVIHLTDDNSNGISIRNAGGSETAKITANGVFTGTYQKNIFQTSDPGSGSGLTSGYVLFVYE